MLMGYVMLMVSVWLLKILSSYRMKKGDNLVQKKKFHQKGSCNLFPNVSSKPNLNRA